MDEFSEAQAAREEWAEQDRRESEYDLHLEHVAWEQVERVGEVPLPGEKP